MVNAFLLPYTAFGMLQIVIPQDCTSGLYEQAVASDLPATINGCNGVTAQGSFKKTFRLGVPISPDRSNAWVPGAIAQQDNQPMVP